ncbi:MAG: hypothetical protein K2W95_02530 [Candidatus Obscuribacterales bacterium]|nr:hypothetical protein [Candidatus Obscuribacterales bacterium]
MTSPEKHETLKKATLIDHESDSEEVAEKIVIKVDESHTETSANPPSATNCLADTSPVLDSKASSSPTSNPVWSTSDNANHEGPAMLPVFEKNAFTNTIICCYLPVVLYLLFAFVVGTDDSPSQLVRYSPLLVMLPFAMLLPLQLRWRKHVTTLTKTLNLQMGGKFAFPERYASWLGFGIGPWVLITIFLGTKVLRGLRSDGIIAGLPPLADIALSLGTVALIIVGTMVPLLVSAVAYLKFFGEINSSVKPVNIASVSPSPFLSSVIVSGGLLLPAMMMCWLNAPLNLVALPCQIGGWWLAFKEIEKYADWVKTNRHS